MGRQSSIASGACFLGSKTTREQLTLSKLVVPLANSSTRAQRLYLTTSQNFLQNRIRNPSRPEALLAPNCQTTRFKFSSKKLCSNCSSFSPSYSNGGPRITIHEPSIIGFRSEQPSERVIYNLINPILIIHHIVALLERGNNFSSFPDVNRSEEEGSVKIPLFQTITPSLLGPKSLLLHVIFYQPKEYSISPRTTVRSSSCFLSYSTVKSYLFQRKLLPRECLSHMERFSLDCCSLGIRTPATSDLPIGSSNYWR